ncbi:VWA-like domain-containing protein, partial [Gordonia sp. (in: high G+C Gram-positive bacteria)]
DVPEIGRELVHLVWHLLDRHAERARGCGVHAGNAPRWRVAADESIHALTRPAGLSPAHFPRGRRRPDEAMIECRFAGLDDGLPVSGYDDPRGLDVCGSGADGVPRSHELNDDHDLPGVTRRDADAVRRAVAHAVVDDPQTGERPPGGGPAPMAVRNWARGLVESRVPWEQVLATAVRRVAATVSGSGDYSYRRPARRSASTPGVVLPGRHRPVPEIAVVIDTSGSMDRRLLRRAVTELDAIIPAAGLGAHGLTAISVDTQAVASRIRRVSDFDLLGGGGTDMSLGLAVTADLRPRPELTIVITDGYTPWPNAPIPGMTVIVTLVGHGHRDDLPPTPAWMVRVDCTEDDH